MLARGCLFLIEIGSFSSNYKTSIILNPYFYNPSRMLYNIIIKCVYTRKLKININIFNMHAFSYTADNKFYISTNLNHRLSPSALIFY